MTPDDRVRIRDTRWNIGPVNFEGQLPPALLEHQGLVPFRWTVDPAVPNECVLALLDRQLTKKDYGSLRGFRLDVRSACVQTRHGVIGVLMFGFVTSGVGEPALIRGLHFDFERLAQATWIDEIAGQTHLHLIIIGRGKKVLDVLQFENTYVLHHLREVMRTALAGSRTDVRAAAEELYADRTIFDVWNDAAEQAENHRAPAQVGLETLIAGGYNMVVVGREEVEAGDISDTLAVFARLRSAPEVARASLGGIDLVVGGYDDDPRELYYIPEVRRWFMRFMDEMPDLFFFLHERSGTATVAMFATSDFKRLEDGRSLLDMKSARAFIDRQIQGAGETMRKFGIDPNGPFAQRHFEAILRPFNR